MQSYSVLMTMYKGDSPEFAKLAIDSMINQSVKTDDFVLVCDGQLTKELNDLVAEYEKKEACFNVVRLPQNVGLGSALKHGVSICKNELIARMDDDDVAKPNRCELELNEFSKNPNLDICGSFMNEFECNPKEVIRIKEVPIFHRDILKFARRRNPFNHSTVMFKKKAILAVGNYSKMRTNQDVDLWVRALNNGLIGYNIPKPLVDFRFDSNTYQRRKDWKNVHLMIKVWKDFYKRNYCSVVDLSYVIFLQVAIYLMPSKLLKWSYDYFR